METPTIVIPSVVAQIGGAGYPLIRVQAESLERSPRGADLLVRIKFSPLQFRHDLLLATLRRAGEIQGKVYKDLDEQNLEAMEKLHRLVESFLPLDERRLALTRIFLFFYAEGAAEETARTEIAGFLARWRNVVSSALTAAQEQGLIDPALDIDTATLSLVGALDGLSFEAVLDPAVMEAISRPEFANTCIDVAIGRTPASR